MTGSRSRPRRKATRDSTPSTSARLLNHAAGEIVLLRRRKEGQLGPPTRGFRQASVKGASWDCQFVRGEFGDARRFANSRDVVRYSGLDITVYQSDAHRAPGHLSRQGPPALRWALYEAAQRARFPASPDRAYYLQLAERIGGNRACLALARKLLKRSYHLLKALGDQALAPVT